MGVTSLMSVAGERGAEGGGERCLFLEVDVAFLIEFLPLGVGVDIAGGSSLGGREGGGGIGRAGKSISESSEMDGDGDGAFFFPLLLADFAEAGVFEVFGSCLERREGVGEEKCERETDLRSTRLEEG